ncbi:MAG: hypothetical protein AAF619_06830 [Pseudomonadota bacterium]
MADQNRAMDVAMRKSEALMERSADVSRTSAEALRQSSDTRQTAKELGERINIWKKLHGISTDP